MRRSALAAVLALATGGCKPTPPAVPASERQLQVEAAALTRDAKAREAVTRSELTRAEAVESQAMAEVQVTDIAAQSGSPVALTEVERRRAVQGKATQRREVAASAHALSVAMVADAERGKTKYEKARDARLTGWKVEMVRSGTRLTVAGGVLMLGGFVGCVLGVSAAIDRAAQTEGVPGVREEERVAALQRSNRQLGAAFGVGVPLLVAGVVMAVLGARRVKENRVKDPRMTLGGGVVLRF